MKHKTCCITGHREINKEKIEFVKERLKEEILKAIKNQFTHFISGFASGTDLIFADIIANLKSNGEKITLEAAIPYRRKLFTANKEFHRLLNECDVIGVLSEKYYNGCLLEHNRKMIQNSDMLIAVYDGRDKGGTLFTMCYAQVLEREIVVIKI